MNNALQFSLRWNNYVTHVTEAFNVLRFENDLVDVTLCCDGGKIKAHKMLLSACSNYFRQIFKENPCQHPVIIFRNFKYEDLNAIINFMYHGEVNIFQEQLESFLITAEFLEVKGLTDNIEEEVAKSHLRISDGTSLDLSAKSRVVDDIVPIMSDEPINLATIQPVKEEYIPQANTSSAPDQENEGPRSEEAKTDESTSSKQKTNTSISEEMQVDQQTTTAEDLSEKNSSGNLCTSFFRFTLLLCSLEIKVF